MELVLTKYKHCDLIEITGRIDSYSSPQIKQMLNALIHDDHYNIIVDLKNVTYLSSSGILTFVDAQRKLKRGGKGLVVFADVPKLVYSSFELAGFNTIFDFFEDKHTAVSHFSKETSMKSKTFPANYKSLAIISDFVVNLAEEAGFSPSDVYAIQTAVDEACSNIIDHAYGGEDLGNIKIKVKETEAKIQIILIDQGEPFVPEDIPEPDITSPLEIRKERGLGIFFMRNLMDKVAFEFSPTKGNTLTLVKYKGS
jgi:serine/threonine-protein kinase RsbW